MKKFDAVIALGFDVTEEGVLPNEGKSRVEAAVGAIKAGESNRAIFTGKVSHLHKYVPVKTEAEAMRDYAISIGLPEEAIVTESESKNTYQNAFLCKKILKANSCSSVLIVTSQFQVERAKHIFKKVLGPKYKIEVRSCKNKLNPEELSLIEQMEDIKTKRLHRKFWHKVVDPRNHRMNQLLKKYLEVRTAS